METRRPLTRPFGEPLELDVLLDFAEVEEADIDSACDWWDSHSSDAWVGALENEPIGKKP